MQVAWPARGIGGTSSRAPPAERLVTTRPRPDVEHPYRRRVQSRSIPGLASKSLVTSAQSDDAATVRPNLRSGATPKPRPASGRTTRLIDRRIRAEPAKGLPHMALTHGRAFRFGVVLSAATSRSEWIDKCRKAEDLGYDTIGVSDHLGKPAPFPAVVLAAEATTRPQLSTYVLNTNFYNPTLLGREVATTNLLTDGRLELGLGTGHIKAQFDAAGLTYPSAAARVDHLESVVAQLQQQPFFFDAGPQVVKRPRLLVGGRGDRVLQLAARYADIIGLSGAASNRPVEGHFPALGSAEMMAERVEYTRHALGDRIREVEFNVVAPVVAPTNELRATLDRLEYLAPSMSVDQRADVPGILAGTPLHIATKLHENRERFGITYTTVLEPSLEAMAPIIERLR